MSLQNRLHKNLFKNLSQDYKITLEYHLIFWGIYFFFNFLRWGSYYHDYYLSLKGNLLGFPIHMALTYFTIYFLLPRFIYRRKFVIFSLLLLSAIFVMVLVKFYLTLVLVSNNAWPEGPVETSRLTANYIINMMVGELYVISFVTAIKITIDRMQENNRVAKLEKMHLETELRFLRSQVSPHFFFNTLNNIYSLTLEKSNKAADTILKLSELMRYLLYEATENKQDLSKELTSLRNYIDLQRIRYGESVTINVDISGEAKGKKIAPMLLIPFLENAFKHGASKVIGKVLIDIKIHIEDTHLDFRILNTIPKNGTPVTRKGFGGIGIENVKKRLQLVYPENHYDLKNYEEHQNYIVELKLELS